ncbi:MAG: ATP-dependent Clp protease proteolytic subunit [Anabaena sp. CoA2_C59]|jgi:ATP-dependent Clp protease protease subunit|uniref:ATP-dependent Clp protease proteolytic subunit n=1 Tax=Aphanizomenon flos-aquae WA102 TaxID=1710896 RepID=A0A1B7X660_APHFL|nr:ATP-dependent Clp protease proteolytic subunit [Aphanizomenon flos-aquae Clear-A1]MCE2904840.1 ATP-dependent Clp protease proteolytic subunit [Anabaena sp. CoA2_C59]MDJ0503994.1 ATP-dependent Clp protease proteolytic subunit [Nostocales cyanobacterium LE14-WE12]NTW21325.1 ATP-dependent Clp protease proteolytic subunit [Nostocales cyanobacterium W4_Combined_metabat2_030]OBQ21285.1 MAG: peptidase S14 [Anabaena sp. WA113]OBQ44851.1 MAG: peptidase S14 [Aphanizomenon flos-aquae WA102]QSV66327.1
MDISHLKAVQAPYSGDSSYRTPPPDLPSLLLKERIVYLGMPLVPAVTELIVAELLYLQSDDPEKPIKIYINSTGTSGYSGEPIGFETEAFAIYDTMKYIKPPIHTICIGSAMGMAAMILSAGTQGCRASLPNSSIILHQPKSYAQGQATDIQIRAREVLANKASMLEILARTTGQDAAKISKDMDRLLYMTPDEAKEYGLIDRVFRKEELANPPLPIGVL